MSERYLKGDDKVKNRSSWREDHFHENAWSWDDKIKNGSSWRGWRGLWAGYEAAPLLCVIEWTLFSFHEQGIASRIAKASPLGSR